MTNERIQHTDEGTGVEVLQLTSFPVIHWLMGPTPDSITPDSSALLLQANSAMVRNSSRDLWRVDSDGDNLELLVEGVFGGVVTVDRIVRQRSVFIDAEDGYLARVVGRGEQVASRAVGANEHRVEPDRCRTQQFQAAFGGIDPEGGDTFGGPESGVEGAPGGVDSE